MNEGGWLMAVALQWHCGGIAVTLEREAAVATASVEAFCFTFFRFDAH